MAAPQAHPWLEPLWRRVLIVALCLTWAAVEALYSGDPLWIAIALGAAVYAGWDFFLRGQYGKAPKS